MADQDRKSPLVAFLCNLLMPGLGHLYLGRYVFALFLFALNLCFLVPLIQMLTSGGNALLVGELESAAGILGVLSAIGGAVAAQGVNRSNERAEQALMVACPFCAEPIKPQAVVCRYCQREI